MESTEQQQQNSNTYTTTTTTTITTTTTTHHQPQQKQQQSISSVADKDGFLIILENLEEVGAIVSSHHSYLEIKQEGPIHFILYLNNNKGLDNSIAFKAVENYVEKKKIHKMCQQASEKYMVSSDDSDWSAVVHEPVHSDNVEEIDEQMKTLLINSEKKKIDENERNMTNPDQLEENIKKIEELERQIENQKKEKEELEKLFDQEQKKVGEYEKKMKEQEEQLEKCVKKTEQLEQLTNNQKTKIEEYEHQLKENEEQMNKQTVEPISSNSPLHFLNENNLEITRNSPAVIDGLANRLHKKEEGDYMKPPLENIHSLEQRRKEVIAYMEEYNWNNPQPGTRVTLSIFHWFRGNERLGRYKPSEEEQEKSRTLFSNKFNLGNTVGTIHFLPFQYYEETRYLCFAICNYRIVEIFMDYTHQMAHSYVYKSLKGSTWTETSKFATEMEVNDEQSDIFIHTSRRDVFFENEKFVTWFKKSFHMDKQQTRDFGNSIIILPTLCNLILKFHNPNII